MMLSSRRALVLLAAFVLLAPGLAGAEEASPWARGFHSRIRLVDGGGAQGPDRLAAVEIALDKGYKTYWRHPGESGLPPGFDWSGSTNLAEAEVLWPAPTRAEDAGGVTYVYPDGVILPVRVTPEDASKPVRLVLGVSYGVCKEICIPAQADLALSLAPGGADASRPQVAAALGRVPAKVALGAAGAPLAVERVEPAVVAGKPRLEVEVRLPADAPAPPVLFVEGPDGWFLSPSPAPETSPAAPARGTFLVEVAERPKDAAGLVRLRLTLVAGGRAIETEATLDAAELPR